MFENSDCPLVITIVYDGGNNAAYAPTFAFIKGNGYGGGNEATVDGDTKVIVDGVPLEP